MTSIDNSEVIIVNKQKQTVRYVTTDENGKKQILTVFANSGANTGDKSLDAKFDKVFDPGDRITVTDANGKEIKDAKFDAGVVTNLLREVGARDINEVAAMKSVNGSGILFDASVYKDNGITKRIKNLNQLFYHASDANSVAQPKSNYTPPWGQNWMPSPWGGVNNGFNPYSGMPNNWFNPYGGMNNNWFNPYGGMNSSDFYGQFNPKKNDLIDEIIRYITKDKAKTKEKEPAAEETSSSSDSESTKLSPKQIDKALSTLGLDADARKAITSCLPNLSQEERDKLVAQLKEVDNIPKDSNASADAIISKFRDEWVAETKAEIKRKDEIKKADALDTARSLHNEIVATWFDRGNFNKAIADINKDNVIEILEAYKNLPGNKGKENLWAAIMGEWSTTAYKRDCYSPIVKALNEKAKECGIDIKTDKDFRNFNFAFETEFSKTGLFSGNTKEEVVEPLFKKVYEKVKEKDDSIKEERARRLG